MTVEQMIDLLKSYPKTATVCFGDVGDAELYVMSIEYSPSDNRIYLQ